MKKEEKRCCPVCSEILVGRIDKKFCDDQCRVMYHNRIRNERVPDLKTISATLRRNRLILEEFRKTQSRNQRKIQKTDLIQKGYNFTYFTHQISQKHYGVFDVSLIEESQEEYSILYTSSTNH
jgi:predicted nucleic acid-binding Zn ribbon protein